MDNSTPGGIDWTAYADDPTTTGSTSSGTGSSTNWFNNLAGLATAAGTAYRASQTPQPRPASTSLPLLIAGAIGLIGLVFVIVFVSRK